MLEFLIFLVGAQFGVIGTIVLSLYMEKVMNRITTGPPVEEEPKKPAGQPILV